MSDPKRHDQRGHDNVWLLLPWYVNGTLEAPERCLVDEHLAVCALCRDELGRCGGLSAALRSGEESAPSPHPIQLARLLERIDASERALELGEDAEPADRDKRAARDEAGVRTARAGRAGYGGSVLAATPRAVRILLAGQLAAMLLMAAALALGATRMTRMPRSAGSSQPLRAPLAGAPPAAYHTLSAPAGDEGAAASRPQIRVVFAEGATEKKIREVLLRARGRLIDGPSPLGTYLLEIPAPPADGSSGGGERPGAAGATPSNPPAATRELPTYGAPPDSLAIVLSYLRAQPIVRFAEPVGTARPGVATGGRTPPTPP